LSLAGAGEFALVLFKLGQDLNLLPIDVARLLDASVILSMSLTPLLGDLGDFAGRLMDGTASDKKKQVILLDEATVLFDKIDTDQSASITIDELRVALLKLKFSFSCIADIFERFDTSKDGLISRDEWNAGVQEGYILQAWNANAANEALSDSQAIYAEDALVILGYGQLGKSILKVLLASPGFTGTQGNVICFDLDPSRVTSGVLFGDPVVYGDGVKFDLLKAAGVTKPRGVIVTFASDSRKIDATVQLRAALPSSTPIYVYEGKSRIGQTLIKAGATEVVSETIETVLCFGTLVGASQTAQETAAVRRLAFRKLEMGDSDKSEDPQLVPGLDNDSVTDLADELGVSVREIMELWEVFNLFARDGDCVPISELKDRRKRSGTNGPGNKSFLLTCLDAFDEDGNGEVTFLEYARSFWRESGARDSS